jgi:hypothetical protein
MAGKFTVYRNFRWSTEQDPSVDAMRTMIKAENHLTDGRASAITGISAATFTAWFSGKTKRPQNATLTQASAALGYVRRDELDRNGQVHIGYVRARDLDYEREIEKQADFLLKHGRKKKKRTKRKTNGHGSST